MSFAIDARLVCGTSTGDSTYWTGLLQGLSQLEFPETVLLYSNAPKPLNIPWHPNFRWILLEARSSRWWSLVQFPLAARRAGASVVHTQYSLSPLVRKGGISTIHDVSFLIGPDWFSARDRVLLRHSIPATVKRAARVITVSATSRREIESLIPAAKGKTEVTYNACPSWIEAVPRAVASDVVHERLGLDGPFLLTVGTRWPRKNMRLAVDAVQMLPPELPHKLVVTGKAGWGDQTIGTRGVGVGYVDNYLLSCLYSSAEMYLAPSFHEGFGIPLLEAFRCGCPVLCSEGGALPEVAGDAARVVRSWEAGEWARQIQETLGDRSTLDSLRQRGLRREREFSWEQTARQTLEIYREVAL